MGIVARFAVRVAAVALLCAAPLLAQARPAADDIVTYRVKRGDTLIGFSQRYLTNAADYSKVAAANGLRDADKLRPGQQLSVPVDLLKSKPIEATVLAFTGVVTVKARSGTRSATVGMPLNEGQTIATGEDGFLSFLLSTGARIAMPSRSSVRILRMRRYDLTGGADLDFAVDRGRTETSVKPMKDGVSRFRMRTPVAVSAVRGTTFRIGYDGEAAPSLTEVIEGSVGVGATATGQTSAVPGGFGVAARLSGDLAQEKLLPPPAMVDPGRLQQDTDLRFDIKPNDSAIGHHVQLSRDAGFMDIFAATRSAAARIEFLGIPDGVYFVRSMAIAKSGLEGLSDTYAFKRQLVTLSAARSASNPNEFLFSWAGQSKAKQTFRFQLIEAKDADAAGNLVPIIDEPGLADPSIVLVRPKPAIYQWRVGTRTYPDDGEGISWSPFQKLTISQ